MDRQTKVKINTCCRWEWLRLPGVGSKIADRIFDMREEGVQFNGETGKHR
jgi:DNA uptake protein ComE-like DNA-binding protein